MTPIEESNREELALVELVLFIAGSNSDGGDDDVVILSTEPEWLAKVLGELGQTLAVEESTTLAKDDVEDDMPLVQ